MSRFELKIVATLLAIAVIPLVTSVYLVSQIVRVSDSVAEGTSRQLAAPLGKAADAYRQLFASYKKTFQLQAQLASQDRLLRDGIAENDTAALQTRLRQLLSELDLLGRISLRRPGSTPLTLSATKPQRAGRSLTLKVPLQQTAGQLELVFFAPQAPFDDFQALGQARLAAQELTSLRGELSQYYRVAFFIVFGAVLLAATAIGIFIARHTTRQVAVLAHATRSVADGDLETQVQVTGKDELGELAGAFNEMVRQLRENRERISYLEKIGAWQEIARRLAHEIKNPLTPIQLAVQQVHRKYDGGDERFQRMLNDARDIVSEEIEGLRRLVQAFSAFARLPEVQPEPEDLNSLIDDFLKSHVELAERAQIPAWTPLPPPSNVLIDRMLIKHVLYNLVENAAQAAEEEGQESLTVSLSARCDKPRKRVYLTIKDDGPGMPPEVVARIFDPYFTTKEQGTGLGLAIVKKIVLEHGGSIDVQSEIDVGSEFTLALPLVLHPSQASTIRTTISRLLGTSLGKNVASAKGGAPAGPEDD